MKRTTKLVIAALSLVTVVALAALIIAANSLQNMITQRLEKGWVIPPLEIYSQGIPLSAGRKFPRELVQAELNTRGLQRGRDYEFLDANACAQATATEPGDLALECFWLKSEKLLVTWNAEGWIQEVWSGDHLAPVARHALFPRLITQFHNDRPILQDNTPLSEIPLYCLQAVTAIEDRDFLEHKGVSPTGIMRAIMRNLKAGRWAEGGSTITQQLVKNFFLSPKKTIRRKLQEQALAVMLESQIGKDQILEMYLNVIYMGQSGPYQVLGFGSAAQHYFDKPVGKLSLPECALMGAIVNNPGRYSPFQHPDLAKQRRELVLSKMVEAGMLSESEKASAAQAELPKIPTQELRAPAPYFVLSALKEFQALDLPVEEGGRIYTSLDPEMQTSMIAAAKDVIGKVEGRVKKPSKQPLQLAAITIDLLNGQVLALTGGRDFRTTQYNRAYDSRRQIGSIVKPFVYLPALPENDPLTAVEDSPFQWKVGRNVWKPRNYDGKTLGPVPYFFALAQSLNIPAAKIGQDVGLELIAETIANAGIEAKVPRLPSLTLGAFELSLWEVAQGYATIARFGVYQPIHTVLRVEDTRGEVVFEREDESEQKLDPQATAVLVGMMRQSVEIGTARAVRAYGLKGSYAGKTGTTSDTKDAWFAGFDGRLLTVVWVGYDDNTAMGLTGASAALPVWVEVTKASQSIFPPREFTWPSGVEMRAVSRDQLQEQFPGLPELPESLDLIFADWAY